MPTTYTPSATATQAPSPQPGPSNAPTPALPVDADAANAASVAQAFKCLADRAAWEGAPRATASSWAEAIKAYKSAALHTRFAVDHLGFPAGKLIAWQEDWNNPAFAGLATSPAARAASPLVGRWSLFIVAPVGAFSGIDLNFATVGGAALWLQNSTAASSIYVGLYGWRALLNAGPNYALAAQWDAYCTSFAGTADDWEPTMGLTTSPGSPSSGSIATLNYEGAYFGRRLGDANWMAFTRPFSGSLTAVNTGIPVVNSVPHRFRIEIVGASASDNATAYAAFYIDGVLVASSPITVTITGGLAPRFSVWGRVTPTNLFIGALDVRQNTWAGDVLL